MDAAGSFFVDSPRSIDTSKSESQNSISKTDCDLRVAKTKCRPSGDQDIQCVVFFSKVSKQQHNLMNFNKKSKNIFLYDSVKEKGGGGISQLTDKFKISNTTFSRFRFLKMIKGHIRSG